MKKTKIIEPEFYAIIKDLLDHEDIQKLGNIKHHGHSILHHSLKVSFLSWKWGKFFKLCSHSIARGALLHDFFLYDWSKVNIHPDKKFYEIHKLHGFTHPVTALENSTRRFRLNKIEENIIIRHMFPLTIIPPKYKESWLVMLVDKIVAISEIPRYLFSLIHKK